MNLTATIGAAAVLTALAAALFAVGASVIASQRGRPELLLAARRAMPVAAAFTTLAIATLAYALLNDDFSLSHVASVSSSDMLPHMKWASLYSGQPGSLLFWTWLLSLFLAAFTLLTVPRIPWGSAQAVAIGGGILAAFLLPVAFLASPFEVSPVTPEDGVGLNPLLVDRSMLIHPPFMLAGLVSTAVPFTLGAAALLSGRIDGRWLRSVRHWALLSWLMLSIGNLLGAFWAYTTLGWGGYWGWDPVENSAILPLLPMTAFVHSMMVQERRGMLKLWNLALVLAAFALAVFGTFNVRSGLVASVHSFALSDVGPYFLALLGLTLLGSVVLLAMRSGRLQAEHDFESLASRESSLIVNNYLFTVIALIILGATLFPVFSELLQDARITVSAPFYNDVVGPLLVALLVLMSIGTVLPWRRAARSTLLRRFRGPIAVALLSILLLAAAGVRDRYALAAMAAAIVLLFVTLREFALGARALRAASGRHWPAAVLALFERDRRRYGGYLVHLGLGVMAIAAVASSVYQGADTRPGRARRVVRDRPLHGRLHRPLRTRGRGERHRLRGGRGAARGGCREVRRGPRARAALLRQLPGPAADEGGHRVGAARGPLPLPPGLGRGGRRGDQRLREPVDDLALDRRRRLRGGRPGGLRAGERPRAAAPRSALGSPRQADRGGLRCSPERSRAR